MFKRLFIFNPALATHEVAGITKLSMLIMLVVNRINQATLSIQQAKSVDKLLRSMHTQQNNAGAFESLRKELTGVSAILAATVSAKRQYTKQIGAGMYQIDPRFLLFEFFFRCLLY